MGLSALPGWLRTAVIAVVAFGMLSVVAIPFVDATRMGAAPTWAADTYAYTLDLGEDGAVRVTVVDGEVSDLDVLRCRTGVDCADLAATLAPLPRIAELGSAPGWTVTGAGPSLRARFEHPGAEPIRVRVVEYREG